MENDTNNDNNKHNDMRQLQLEHQQPQHFYNKSTRTTNSLFQRVLSTSDQIISNHTSITSPQFIPTNTTTTTAYIRHNHTQQQQHDHANVYRDSYPITLVIIGTMHLVHYYQLYQDWKRYKRRIARRNTRSSLDTNSSSQDDDQIEEQSRSSSSPKIEYQRNENTYINYQRMVIEKQWYRWWIAIFSIQQYTMLPSTTTTTTTVASAIATTPVTTTSNSSRNNENENLNNRNLSRRRWVRRYCLSLPFYLISTIHSFRWNVAIGNNNSPHNNHSYRLVILQRQLLRTFRSILLGIRSLFLTCYRCIVQSSLYIAQQFHNPNGRHLSLYRRIPMILIMNMTLLWSRYYTRIYSSIVNSNSNPTTRSNTLLLLLSCRRIKNFIPAQQHQVYSILLLLYITHLLWSCRILEWYYYHYVPNIQLYWDDTSRPQHILAIVDTKYDDVVGRTIMYLRVWIGIGVGATLLALLYRISVMQFMYRIHRTVLYFIFLKRHQHRPAILQPQTQDDSNDNGTNNNDWRSVYNNDDTNSFITSNNISGSENEETEQPDIIPYLEVPSTRTDRIYDVYIRKSEQVQKVVYIMSTDMIRVNMIQMISSLLIVYRCIIIQQNYRTLYENILRFDGTDHNTRNGDDDLVQQRLYIYHEFIQEQLTKHGILSPIPFLKWPTYILGANLSYVLCIIILYWLSWLLYDNNATAATTEVSVEGTENFSSSNEASTAEIPLRNNLIDSSNDDSGSTNSSVSVPSSSSSSDATWYVLISIIYGTLVGYAWGNSIFMTDSIATSHNISNMVILVVCVGSLISLKVNYPNRCVVRFCISSIGCNRNGQVLTYDPHQNSYINLNDIEECNSPCDQGQQNSHTSRNAESSEIGSINRNVGEVQNHHDGDVEQNTIRQAIFDDQRSEMVPLLSTPNPYASGTGTDSSLSVTASKENVSENNNCNNHNLRSRRCTISSVGAS